MMQKLPGELNFARHRRLPILVGAEAAECGLVCLAMVGAWHGHRVDLNGLRQRYALSNTGATLRSIMDLADRLQLSSRALRIDLDGLWQIKTPAILHWDLNHFVVLRGVSRRSVTIHDPASGLRRLTWEQASTHFTGVALELTPSASFVPIHAKAPTRITHLWSRIDGFWPAVGQVAGLSIALQVFAFATPFYIQLVVDQAIARSDAALLLTLAIAFGCLVLLQTVVEALRAWTLLAVGQLANFQITGNLIRHLLRVRADFFEKRHIGDLVSRLGSVKILQDLITRGIAAALIDGAMAILAAALLVIYSRPLAIVVGMAVLLHFAVAMAAYPMMRRRLEEQLNEDANEQSYLMETLRAATTIRLLGREAEREGVWRNLYARVMNASVSLGKWQISVQATRTLLTGLQTILVIYLGARAVISGSGFSLGMLFAFLALRQTFTDRATTFIEQIIQFRLLGLHLDRLGDIIHAEPEAREDAPAAPAATVEGSLALEGVSFAYGATDRPVLRSVDLSVRAGEFVAITGPSGGGKSTLLKLLLGLQRPTSGRVVLDGRPASPADWRAWRSQVGVVAQEDRLLSGTLAENIAFFDPGLDMQRVVQAAQAARIHDEISCMPMQYMSLVGDMGSALSGGQKQRVLLARALYRQPKILFLDEGTANLDEAAEQSIASLIASLPITRIVVAHRPALLECADRVILVKDAGVHDVCGPAAPRTAMSHRRTDLKGPEGNYDNKSAGALP